MQVALHLPDGPVPLEINPVRCVPLDAQDVGQGYLLAARIIEVKDRLEQFESYLLSLVNP